MSKRHRQDRERSLCRAARRAACHHSAVGCWRLPARRRAALGGNYLPQDMDRLTASYFLLDRFQMTAFAELLSDALQSETTGPDRSSDAVTGTGSLLTISNA